MLPGESVQTRAEGPFSVRWGSFAVAAFAATCRSPLSPTNIFAPVSTPAQSIFDLSRFVLLVTGSIFIVVFSLLAYAVIASSGKKRSSEGREPAQVFGSTQVELAWTVIPVLIVVVLFLAASACRRQHPGCSTSRPRHSSDCNRTSVLVGVSISIAESGHRE